MTNIVEMARKARFNVNENALLLIYLEHFAEMIRTNEREACAKVCDELHWPWHIGDNSGPKECATKIRARNTK
jgi:hypothetical protein